MKWKFRFWTSTKSVVVSPWVSSSANPTRGKTSPASSTRVTVSPVPSSRSPTSVSSSVLDGGIDGLVHLSDISWNEVGEEAVRRFKKGDELETVILSVDPERERISLGIKQLEDDPFSNYASLHEKGSIVRGTVKEVDAKGAVISLGDDIEGILKASEISRDRVEDARNVLKEGEEVEAKIISIDRKSRVISLSVKSKDVDDEKDAMKELRKQEVESAGPTTIGDLIRAQMENQG